MSPAFRMATSITHRAQSSWISVGGILLDPMSLNRLSELNFVKSRSWLSQSSFIMILGHEKEVIVTQGLGEEYNSDRVHIRGNNGVKTHGASI